MTNSGNLEKLLLDMKESLEREIHDFREEVRTRFDNQDARMQHEFGLLESGRRRIA
jgi:molybdopterin synthase catalytic subunit